MSLYRVCVPTALDAMHINAVSESVVMRPCGDGTDKNYGFMNPRQLGKIIEDIKREHDTAAGLPDCVTWLECKLYEMLN